MRWFGFIDIWAPLVFNPKVTPDPDSAVRLDEKFEQAMKKLKQGSQRGQPAAPETPL